jgi:hypothetical protein
MRIGAAVSPRLSSGMAPSLMSIGEGRFKRSLLGYRRREVDQAIGDRDAAIAAIAARLGDAERLIAERERDLDVRTSTLARSRQRIEELERVGTRLAERVAERGEDLRAARAEVAALRAHGDEGLRALAALADDLETVRRQARGQATRMRLRALREAADLTRRMGELGDGPDEAKEALTRSLREAIERVGGGDDEEDPLDAASNGHIERPAGELFEGVVEVEVGPLSDFSQLVGFEDAAAGIGATSEVSVRRFTQGRATLAMRFKHPVELLSELEERAPFEFRVRDTRSDRVVLDVGE